MSNPGARHKRIRIPGARAGSDQASQEREGGRLVIVISLIIILAAADTVRVTHSALISSLFKTEFTRHCILFHIESSCLKVIFSYLGTSKSPSFPSENFTANFRSINGESLQ